MPIKRVTLEKTNSSVNCQHFKLQPHTSVVNCILLKITVCSNYTTLQCYNLYRYYSRYLTTIYTKRISRNNSGLLKFHYTIAAI